MRPVRALHGIQAKRRPVIALSLEVAAADRAVSLPLDCHERPTALSALALAQPAPMPGDEAGGVVGDEETSIPMKQTHGRTPPLIGSVLQMCLRCAPCSKQNLLALMPPAKDGPQGFQRKMRLRV